MNLDETIAMLKSRTQVLIQEKENPTYNLIVMSYKVSKDFLSKMRKKKELEDIKCKYPPGFETKLDRGLPADSVIFMQDLEPMAAWIGGKLKMITKRSSRGNL